ncbi:MAG: NAD-dependent epimerase/dehydratase family protein [Gammaproteobacteria bacterium]
MNARRTIFLAGAGGAIGRRLCPLLVDAGWTVVGTTRSEDKAAVLEAMGVEPVIVDVFDAGRLKEVVRKTRPDVVMHQLTDLPPALDPARMAQARVRNARIREEGTRNLVAAAVAAGARRLVAQSIAFAYAPGETPYREDAPLDLEDPAVAVTARAVARLEEQVLNAPMEGVVLRYGRLYGPGTGFDSPASAGPLHVDAAAYAALLAATDGESGIYNVAEVDGAVSSEKAVTILGWRADFRLTGLPGDSMVGGHHVT